MLGAASKELRSAPAPAAIRFNAEARSLVMMSANEAVPAASSAKPGVDGSEEISRIAASRRQARPVPPARGRASARPNLTAAPPNVEIGRGGEERHLAAGNADLMQVVGEFLDGAHRHADRRGLFFEHFLRRLRAGRAPRRLHDGRSRADSVRGDEACVCAAYSAAAATSRLYHRRART